MDRVSIRDLRQNVSRWLQRVRAGESFEVTDRGRPVALLVPLPPAGERERLIAAHRLRPADGDILELDAPLPPLAGESLPSEILEQLRAGER